MLLRLVVSFQERHCIFYLSETDCNKSDLINSFSPDDRQVHYTARFPDGTVFDSTYKRGRPLTMRIGAGKVCSICSAHTEDASCSLNLPCHHKSLDDTPVSYRLQILRGLEQGISGGGGVPPMLVGMVMSCAIEALACCTYILT